MDRKSQDSAAPDRTRGFWAQAPPALGFVPATLPMDEVDGEFCAFLEGDRGRKPIRALAASPLR